MKPPRNFLFGGDDITLAREKFYTLFLHHLNVLCKTSEYLSISVSFILMYSCIAGQKRIKEKFSEKNEESDRIFQLYHSGAN